MALNDCADAGVFRQVDTSMTVPGFLGVGVSILQGNTKLPAIKFSWTAITSIYIQRVEVEYQVADLSTPPTNARGNKADLGILVTNGIVAGKSFTARYRAVGDLVDGPWSAPITVFVPIDARIYVGGTGQPGAIQDLIFQVTDQSNVSFLGGLSLGLVPDILPYSSVGLDPLAAGESYLLYNDLLSPTGCRVNLKIAVPGPLVPVTQGPGSSYGTGPTWQMDKADADDAASGVYRFSWSADVEMPWTAIAGGGGVLSWEPADGIVSAQTWFSAADGVWVTGPTISFYVPASFSSPPPDPPNYEFETTTTIQSSNGIADVDWSTAVGQHAGREFGLSDISGGTITAFDQVDYSKQSISGTRTATPGGQTIRMTVRPKNNV